MVAGDSAGGNLAIAVARRLRDTVAGMALIYPVTDAGLNTPSMRDFKERYGLTAAGLQRYWNLYLDGADGFQPDASPLRADDLEGLPPTYVLTSEFDILRDEGEAFVKKLEEAGVDVTHRRFDGTIHGFWRWMAATPKTREAIDEVGAWLAARSQAADAAGRDVVERAGDVEARQRLAHAPDAVARHRAGDLVVAAVGPAVRVGDQHDGGGPGQLARRRERLQHVVGHHRARVADHVRVAELQPQRAQRVQPRVHAAHDRHPACGHRGRGHGRRCGSGLAPPVGRPAEAH